MAKNSQINNDEINLIELIGEIWDGKFKIIIAVAISFLTVLSYQLTQKKNFTAVTEIKPISSFEINKYIYFNSIIKSFKESQDVELQLDKDIDIEFNKDIDIDIDIENEFENKTIFSQITVSKFLELYLEFLNEKTIFEEAIRKFNLVDPKQFSSDQAYNEAIAKLASSIKILSPKNQKKNSEGNSEISYSTIEFVYNDSEKWKPALLYVHTSLNEMIRKNLNEKFKKDLLISRQKNKYALDDIKVKINNLKIDYDRKMKNKIYYLKEQSEIAKQLGIAKNTIEVQTFGNQNALLSNVKTDSPFYLRGYEAIDKEIELINLRTDKNAFIKGLFELEQKERKISQDKRLNRIQTAFQSTPLVDKNQFSAVTVNVIATKFKYENGNFILMISIAAGIIIGVFYVFISNAIQLNRVKRKK